MTIEEFEILKINIFGKDEIVNTFLKSINATLLEKKKIGVEFAFLLKDKKRFQFWLMNNEFDEKLIPNYLLGSKAILYFYQVDYPINEDFLKILKKELKSIRRGFVFRTPLIFVMYGSKEPKNAENNKNFKIIKNIFDPANYMWVDVNDHEKMLKIFYFIASMTAMN